MIIKPVFLVGARRSGTTLFRLLLDHHPDIGWNHLGFEYAVERIGSHGEWPQLADYRAWVQTQPTFKAQNFTLDPALSYPELVDSFLVQKRDRDGKRIVGATVHYAFDRIACVWPDARLIYVVRDPRGVAASNLRLNWAANGWSAVQSWLDAEATWAEVRRTLPDEQCLTITYEEMVRNTEATLQRVCDFIGVAYDETMLDYSSGGEEPPSAHHLDKWRKQVGEYDIRLIEARVGDRLQAHGYTASGLPPLSVSPLQARRLRWQDRWFRARKRMAQYGFALFAADALARRLGLRGWQRRIRERMNAIDTGA